LFLGSFEALPQSLALFTSSLFSVSSNESGLEFLGATVLGLLFLKELTSADFSFLFFSRFSPFFESALEGFCLLLTWISSISLSILFFLTLSTLRFLDSLFTDLL
jgi:hypothetical protein